MLDGGDLMWRSTRLSDRRLAQQQIKGKLQLSSLTERGIDAMVPGAGDLALGLGWLTDMASATGAPYAAANLTCDGTAPFPATRAIDIDGLKVVVAGVLATTDQVPEGCEVSEPEQALTAALAPITDAHLIVVLSRLDESADARLSMALPQVDLIVAGGSKSPRPTPTLTDTGAARLQMGARGKQLGQATITLVPGADRFSGALQVDDLAKDLARMKKRLASAEQQLAKAADDRSKERAQRRIDHYKSEIPKREAALAAARDSASKPAHTLEMRLTSLDDRVADHPATLAAVEQANADIAAFETAARPSKRVENGPFIGSGACIGCHPAESAQWKSTSHASAWATLEADQRHMDLDCWSCHATGAFHPEGPQHPTQVGDLKNVGCESCHGPGRDHVDAPAAGQMNVSPGQERCVNCHDGTQDEGRFDFDAYLPKVVHGPPGQ